jgi:quercetin dioxygenase-like cupin family protein
MAARGDVYVLHDGERVTIRTTAAESGGELLEMEAEWTPLEHRPPVHRHPLQEERFELSAGELSVKLDGEIRVLRAGDALTIPAGATHSMWNSGEETMRASWQLRPALRSEEFFAAVHELRAAGCAGENGMITLPAAGLAFSAFPDEFQLPLPGPLRRPLVAALALFARLRGYPSLTPARRSPSPTGASASIG